MDTFSPLIENLASYVAAERQKRNFAIYEAFMGVGSSKLYERADDLLRQVKSSNDPNILYEVGLFHVTGNGAELSPKTALRYFLRAAENGQVEAQFEAAELYRLGREIAPNIRAAIHWYTQAANADHLWSRLILAAIYSDPTRDEYDSSLAAEWLSKAAVLDSGEAMVNLGCSYYFGRGVEQNYQLARNWYLRAASEQGGYNSKAEFNLGLMYEFGLGVPRDLLLAHHFYFFASDAEEEIAQAHDRLTIISQEAEEHFFAAALIPADFTDDYIEFSTLGDDLDFGYDCPICNTYNYTPMGITDHWVDTRCGGDTAEWGCGQKFRRYVSGRFFLNKREPGDEGTEAIDVFEGKYLATKDAFARDPRYRK